MSIGSGRMELLFEADRYLALAEKAEGRRRLNFLMQARDHYLSGGRAGKARVIEGVIRRESRAGLGLQP